MKDEKNKIIFLKNEIVIEDIDITTAKMVAEKDNNMFALIDNHKNIKDSILGTNWLIGTNGYPVTRSGRRDIKMHQFVMDKCFGSDYVPKKATNNVIDHLNNNPCDNRLRNLHILSVWRNNDKRALDLNFDNITVYIEYDYDFDHMPIIYNGSLYENNDNGSSLLDIKKIYDNRKYILSYVADNMIFFTSSGQKFNNFELVYNDYDKFIKDVKKISKKTQEVNRINRLTNKNPYSRDLKGIRGIEDISLNKQRQIKHFQSILGILSAREWTEIRNVYCNIMSKQEWEQLTKQERHFYLTLNKTAYQWLPPDIPLL